MNKFQVIDFHSHVLPKTDHGCSGTEESVAQLALMAQNGADIAVATPHFYPHEFNINSYVQLIDKAVSKVQAAKPSCAPKLAVGAEVLLYPNMHLMDGFEQLHIRGTRTMLVELPLFEISASYYETVEEILDSGTTVILAHIDRYLGSYEGEIDTLLSMGALAQINAYSLAGSRIRKKIVNYLETTDKICAIGSDLHRVDVKSYKKFAKAEKILGEHYEAIMKRANELLAGAEFII